MKNFRSFNMRSRSFRPFCTGRGTGFIGLGTIVLGAIVALATVGALASRSSEKALPRKKDEMQEALSEG